MLSVQSLPRGTRSGGKVVPGLGNVVGRGLYLQEAAPPGCRKVVTANRGRQGGCVPGTQVSAGCE